MMLRLLALIALLTVFLSMSRVAFATPPDVNVLVLTSGNMKLDTALRDQFAVEHVQFVLRSLSDPLSLDMMKQFHVVVIADWEGPSTTFYPRSLLQRCLTSQHNTELVYDYVEAGGGFLFCPIYGSEMQAESLSRYLAPLGAGIQCAQVRDDTHAFGNTKPEKAEDFQDYAWTTNIASHPATRGVQRVYYPTPELRWDNLYSTPVITLQSPAWTPLVKGMPSSYAAKGTDYYNWEPAGGKAPVIAAARSYGEGRVALFGPNELYWFDKPFDSPKRGWVLEAHVGKMDGVVLDKGDGVHPSQGRQLITGMLRWLAEGARAKGFGGYTEKSFAALTVPAPAAAPNWLASWKPGDGNQWFKVLVGARSSFSDGSGTIAEYASAAKAAGVSMLYMTETFEKFAPARWDEYRAACAKASDDTLKVVAGFDITDTQGNRYLLLGSPLFPAPSLLTADGKAMAKPQYLNLCFPKGITVQHRSTTTPVPYQMAKHFQGVTLYTYRNGVLEDNSLPAYEWQVYRFSNPMPFVVHETYAPADVAKEASTGHQLYGAADSLADMAWDLGEHGTSHFWESPVRLQVSAGPMITELGGSTPNPGEPSVRNALRFSVHSDEPLKEVVMLENFNVYRRWKPAGKDFTANDVKLPESHANWVTIIATDIKGNSVVSPGVMFGPQIVHTWRCGDRQNWWVFPNIYTGTDVSQFDIQVPTFDTIEGSGVYPQVAGPQRGDNLAPLLDFSLASPATYIQDVFIDQRYPRAVFWDAAFDAKAANVTSRSTVYEAKVRYNRYFAAKPRNDFDYLPDRKDITITLRKPIEPTGDIFPVITSLRTKHAQVYGDMSYAYVDSATGKEVTGRLSKGYLDLPKGGRIGGFIALSDGIRVSANGIVGFAAPTWSNGALPAGTTWHATFATVQPSEADTWRGVMGLRTEQPFKLVVKSGKFTDLTYAANCTAEAYGFEASVASPLDAAVLPTLTTSVVNDNKEAAGKPLNEYRMPITVSGVNYNWPAHIAQGGTLDEIPVFEGKAYARVDVTKAGDFFVGNSIMCDVPNLRIGLLRWTADACVVEVNNPTGNDVDASIWTAAAITDRFQGRVKVAVKAGTSTEVTLAK